MDFLSEMKPWSAAGLLAAVMTVAWVAGLLWGRSGRGGSGPAPDTKLDDAGLALLGLLLAFTFSMAINKFDRRREMLVADTNAIGDFYTCASLLPEPGRTSLQDVVRDYTKLRLEVSYLRASLEPSLERLEAMQARMTVLVGEALGAGTPIAVPLTNTLNALTSSHAARLATVRDRLPGSILSLLTISAIFSAVLVARQQGYSPRPSLLGTACFISVVALTFFVILDLNHPREGLIQISLEPMQRLLASMSR